MAVTLQQVRQLVSPEEPNYAAAARLGPQLLPYLQTLIASPDAMIASKAAYLATLIDDERAVDVVRAATNSPAPVVRIAAAGGIRRMQGAAASGLISRLLNDRDKGVRKLALKAAADRDNAALLAQVANISRTDPTPHVRALASRVLSRRRGGGGQIA